MKKREALRIMKKEKLSRKNFFSDLFTQTEEAVIMKNGRNYEVYILGERGTKEGLKVYDNIEAALDDYIKRLRGERELIEFLNG
ncbi:hypothetical protein [Lacticaseibacillus pantheris]|uniref:hypothetical protein n=1 Tax=Lacticaseibacillus pantheris TaxID=171523 RepID=UPI002658839C|nr:hypothetical protein [Lacticaseibacillus pantheris]WKF84418.1 hypothetical protein QY874_09000 [Lacticaseibacillus pantheris]